MRIVIFRQGAIGDLLASVPFIWALKSKYKESKIIYLSESHSDPNIINSIEVSSLIPEIDKAITYKLQDSLLKNIKEFRSLLSPKSDDILFYASYKKNSILSILRDYIFFRIIGFKKIEGINGAIKDIYCNDREEFEYNRIFRYGRSLVSSGKYIYKNINIDSDYAKKVWAKYKLDNRIVITINPISKVSAKCWPLDYYISLIIKLTNLNFIIILVGGNNDKILTDEIINKSYDNVYSIIGSNLIQTASVISKSHLFIGNDSGPLHLAGLLNIPTIGIYSDRDHKTLWYPYGGKKKNKIFRHEMSCGGCLLDKCYDVVPPCLAKTTVDEVFEEAIRTLS